MLTKSYFSNLYLFLSFILFIIGTGLSQNASYLDSLDGKFALQFQINDNFSLSSFQGTTFSGKYHFSCRDAVRLGISVELGDSESEINIVYPDTSTVSKSENDGNKFGITIKTQYIHYFNGTKEITFFGGVGPFFTYSKQNENRKSIIDEIETSSEAETNLFSTGIDIIAGVEWMFYTNMSLSAEYGLNFSYWSLENIYNEDSKEVKSENTTFNISGNHINFGITVYF